jgi:hypothetical protein
LRVGGRVILSIAPAPKPGDEAKVALECIGRLAPGLPGALGTIFDGAFRGVHLVELLRQRGLLPALSRAHSVGRERQLVNLIGFALAVNSLALHHYRARARATGSATG